MFPKVAVTAEPRWLPRRPQGTAAPAASLPRSAGIKHADSRGYVGQCCTLWEIS